MTPGERTLRARLGAYTLHGTRDTRVVSEPGRRAFLRKFYDKTDAMLPEAERQRRAAMLLRAHMTRLALRSAQARRKS